MHEEVSRQLFDDAVRNLTPELCGLRGWALRSAVFPVLGISFAAHGREPARIDVHCDNWNSIPPSVVFVDETGGFVRKISEAPGGQFQQAHPSTGRPFVCMAGVREYHTHPNHLGDLWENYKERPGYDLGGIVTQVWRAWQKAKP